MSKRTYEKMVEEAEVEKLDIYKKRKDTYWRVKMKADKINIDIVADDEDDARKKALETLQNSQVY